MLYDNEEIMAAIWANPNIATGLEFTWRGNAWVSQQDPDGSSHPKSGGRTILRRNPTTGVLYINCNGEGFVQSQGIIKYLKWRWNTNDTYDVYRRLGELYRIKPNFDGIDEERVKRYEKRAERQPIYDAMAEYLTAELNSGKGAATREYLASRGLRTSSRLGAVSEDIIADLKAALSHKLPYLNATQINDYVEAVFTLGAKAGSKGYRINTNDYRLIGPYYNGSGHVAGFWLRLTSKDATYTTQAGEVKARAKYLYSDGLIKNGYCLNLRADKPVILVEGILDAERIRQTAEDLAATEGLEEREAARFDPIDLFNVMAIGGAVPNDTAYDPARSQLETLVRYGVKEVIVVPDLEYYTIEDQARGRGLAGQKKTKNTENTIKAILPRLNGRADGDGFISLRIAQLYNLNPKDTTKQDADSFIRANGPYAFKACLADAVDYYRYQLAAAAAKYEGRRLAAEAETIYLGIVSACDKETLKADITKATGGYLRKLKEAGFTATAMANIDRNSQASTYWENIKADSGALAKAIENNATAEQIGDIIKTAARHQATRADGVSSLGFEAQANATPAQIEQQIANQPEYIETSWQLYKIQENQAKEITKARVERNVSFAPAAISVIAAPTNYGKTAFMMQAALQLAERQDKRYIYLSTEEDQRQLYLRACSCYMGNKWPEGSHPKKDLREAIKVLDLPEILESPDGRSFDIRVELNRYNTKIAPYLKLIYSNEDVTTFCTKIAALVEEWRNEGVEVGGVFIDYMQMIRATGRSYSRADEVQVICAELNRLAKVTGLPLIVGSQMNRQATQGGNSGVGFDGVGLENISDGSGIEKIAQDAYLLWNSNKEIDKGGNDALIDAQGIPKPRTKLGYRTRRIVTADSEIRPNTLYIENLKARDYESGCYALLDFSGLTGAISPLSQYK